MQYTLKLSFEGQTDPDYRDLTYILESQARIFTQSASRPTLPVTFSLRGLSDGPEPGPVLGTAELVGA